MDGERWRQETGWTEDKRQIPSFPCNLILCVIMCFTSPSLDYSLLIWFILLPAPSLPFDLILCLIICFKVSSLIFAIWSHPVASNMFQGVLPAPSLPYDLKLCLIICFKVSSLIFAIWSHPVAFKVSRCFTRPILAIWSQIVSHDLFQSVLPAPSLPHDLKLCLIICFKVSYQPPPCRMISHCVS